MSVIVIIAILSVVVWPSVDGYINRAKRLNVVVQSRNVVEYATSDGINPDNNIQLSELKNNNVFSEYYGKLDTLQDDIQYVTLRDISKDEDTLNKIKNKYSKIIKCNGENPHKKK